MMCLVEGKQTNDYCHAGREASQVLIAEIRNGTILVMMNVVVDPSHAHTLICVDYVI